MLAIDVRALFEAAPGLYLVLAPDPARTIADVISPLEPRAVRLQIALVRARTADDDAVVVADRPRLSQVLMNFGSNALEYGRPHGNARFRVSRVPARLWIWNKRKPSVMDTEYTLAPHGFRPVVHVPHEVPMSTQMELRHLAREVKTCLELAIAAFAPSDLVDRLAVAAGLLEAITDMALDEAATVPLVTRTLERANQAVSAWHQWRNDHPPKATA